MTHRKKLIEVALPLEAINVASAREKSIRHGHPSTLHLWWARRPLAAARAVIFAQMVDDPSANPDLFPTEKAQQKERGRLFKIIEDLVKWENTTNEEVLNRAREEIWQSWRRTCAQNADHPRASEFFDRHVLPAFHDPFAGGGSIPLEAQRLGLVSYASDLNPVAVLINKAMIEIPPKFAGKPPVNPEARRDPALIAGNLKRAQGLAEDVRYYGNWMRREAEKRIGHFYPLVEITAAIVKRRPDLKEYVGQKLTVVAWLWARTVKSPNPAFATVPVPLASSFTLSTKSGKEAFIDPVFEDGGYRFVVKIGKPRDAEFARHGTKLSGTNFRCLMSNTAIEPSYIRKEAQAGRMGERLMAVIAEGKRARVFLSPEDAMESLASSAKAAWKPDLTVPVRCHDVDRLPMYGMPTWGDAFSARQLLALTTYADLVNEARALVEQDWLISGHARAGEELDDPTASAADYSAAIATYLGLAVGRSANYWSALTPWAGNFVVQTFGRNAIRMVWDHAEVNPFSSSTGNWGGAIDWIAAVIDRSLSASAAGYAAQADAQSQSLSVSRVVSTDPPYYDNIGYAELSDFFYVWLRSALKSVEPHIFATLAVPKDEELVAAPHRHGSNERAEAFFLTGMTRAMHRLVEQAHPAYPVTIYYAFKQSETHDAAGTSSTGWETFLAAVIEAGFSITGTWPIRTERDQGLKTGTNVLASSIVLVCRPASHYAPVATRREFLNALKAELPQALTNLQRGNIAPVDLEQAAIGPGMAIFTRYSNVLDADGSQMSVGTAYSLIVAAKDEALTEQDGDLDADSRWALAWFDQYGFFDGEFGVADVLARAKNTSVQGLVDAGVVASKRGKVRLLKSDELPEDWDPTTDTRLSAWETVHHLIRALASGGEAAAAELMKRLGAKAEIGRELAYRLYALSERKKRAADALAYNGLVQSWLEIARIARETSGRAPSDASLFDEGVS